jgi:hypothetical protein
MIVSILMYSFWRFILFFPTLGRLMDQQTDEDKLGLPALKRNVAEVDLGSAGHFFVFPGGGVDLTKIAGIGPNAAMVILSEFGPDVGQRFSTAKKIPLLVGTMSSADTSGGKVLSRGTKRALNRVATALRRAANSFRR